MARNDNQWFKFFFRDWLESERIRNMPLDAQGLYVRMLSYQAIYGNAPAQIEAAEIALHLRNIAQGTWDAAVQHFEEETTEVGLRLFNSRLRGLLVVKQRNSETKAKNRKNKRKTNDTDALPKRKTKASPRASLSNSTSISVFEDDNNSLSALFAEFWDAYPKKRDKKEALEAWSKGVKTPDLARQIISHVKDRAVKDADWLKEDGTFIPYACRFLKRELWTDGYSTAKPSTKTTLSRRPATEGERRNAEMLHHGDIVSRQLTLEEQEAASREAEEAEETWKKENGLA